MLVAILRQKRFMITALIALFAYVVLYLAAMQYLTVAPDISESFIRLQILPGWRALLFRQRGAFLFEPIGALYLGPLVLFLSIPNLAIGFMLGVLVAANIAVSYYDFRALGMQGVRGLYALVGTIPALISGAACCVPTLILVAGLQLTATLAAVWSLLVPVSAVLLVGSLWWSLNRIAVDRVCNIPSKRTGA